MCLTWEQVYVYLVYVGLEGRQVMKRSNFANIETAAALFPLCCILIDFRFDFSNSKFHVGVDYLLC